MKIDNTDRLFYSLLENNDNLINSTVLIREVYRQNLDGWSDPDPTQHITQATYVITQMTTLSSKEVEFKLAAPQDVEQALVGRQMFRHICPRQYRVPTDTQDEFVDINTVGGNVDCPYTGSTYYTEDGQITVDYTEDKCSFTLNGCRLRFGAGAALPYMGFPSIGDPNA